MQKSPIRYTIVILSLLFSLNSYAQPSIDILKKGAFNDGQQKNTALINQNISELSEQGGGTIYFAPGTYLTGPITLKNNITLYLEAGATLLFSDDFDDYLPMVESRWEGVDVINFSPLIYANNVENITIKGRGTIDGQGKKWWDFHHKLYSEPKDYKSKWQIEFAKQNENMLMPDNPYMFERGFCRPPLFQVMNCKNIIIEGITVTNSPFWTINPEFSENININQVTINNPLSPNTDGINPESCKNVHISNCHISVGDDCITIKSGKDAPGRLKDIPCENITITNCTMLKGHGGVVIGSEMSGGIKKVTISNCVFEGTDRGIRIKSTRGRGGVVEDIRVSNVIMKDIRKEAIKLNMFYSKTDDEPVSERTPTFKNIHFNGITGTAYEACFLLGLKERSIENISFTDIRLNTTKGFSITDAKNICINNCEINTKDGMAVNVNTSQNIQINNIRNNNSGQDNPVIKLTDTNKAFIQNCIQFESIDTFLKVDNDCHHIYLNNNSLVDTKNIIAPKSAIKKGIVEIEQ